MAHQLYFGDLAIGTHLLRQWYEAPPETPLVVAAGLWHDNAVVRSLGANRVHRLWVEVAIVANSPVALTEEFVAIAALQHTADDVEIRYGVSVDIAGAGYILERMDTPEIADGFGGRMCERLRLSFAGGAAPTFA